MFKPKGIIIPVVTPIDDAGNFNEGEYVKLLNYFIENGVHGVFPFGTSGEFYALSACLKQRQHGCICRSKSHYAQLK